MYDGRVTKLEIGADNRRGEAEAGTGIKVAAVRSLSIFSLHYSVSRPQ